MPATHLTLACENVAAGAAFFRDVLALPVRQRDEHDVDVDLGMLTATLTPRHDATPGSRPGGSGNDPDRASEATPPERSNPAVIIEVEVDDVREAVLELRRRGATVLVGPVLTEWDTESAFIAGPDGVVVELYRTRGR